MVGPQREATPHKRKARGMPRSKLDVESARVSDPNRLL